MNLEDRVLPATIAVQQGYRVLNGTLGAKVLLFDNEGIELRDPQSAKSLCDWLSTNLLKQELLKSQVGWRWPWHTVSYAEYGMRELLPRAVSMKSDHNGDGQEDILLAGRHQAWVMAISASDGKILWFAGRGTEHCNRNRIVRILAISST